MDLLGRNNLASWCLRWIGLGIMSSIGLGFGLHTFVLFLAPHIASVTIAAQNCSTLNFPEPPYPDEIRCPDSEQADHVTFSSILFKVALEAFMWGLGTAIGELPPYLFTKAIGSRARTKGSPAPKWEIVIKRIIDKIGFIGIVAFAAIPNPLFDAVGAASGAAGVPFLKFFGATVMGKAVIKSLLQASFVIFLFFGDTLDHLIGQFDQRLAELVPASRDLKIHQYFSAIIEDQRVRVRDVTKVGEVSLASSIFRYVITACVALFVLSIAQAVYQNFALVKQYTSNLVQSTRRLVGLEVQAKSERRVKSTRKKD